MDPDERRGTYRSPYDPSTLVGVEDPEQLAKSEPYLVLPPLADDAFGVPDPRRADPDEPVSGSRHRPDPDPDTVLPPVAER